MNISNFNKSLLWVVMLSTISQTYPMWVELPRAARWASKLGAATAVALPVGGFAFAAGRKANVVSALSNQPVDAEVIQEATSNVAKLSDEAIESAAQEIAKEMAPVLSEETSDVLTEELGEAITEAAQDVKAGRIATTWESIKDTTSYVGHYMWDHKIQGICGMVTLVSGAYLLHESGALVKIKNNKLETLKRAGLVTVIAGALAGAAYYVYPEAVLNAAKSALTCATNPYGAAAAATAAAAYGVQSKFKGKKAKAGVVAGVAATGVGLATAGHYGLLDSAKNGIAKAATWTAENVLAPAYNYTVAPVVAKAFEHPYIAGGIGLAAVGAGYGLYKYWKKPAQQEAVLRARLVDLALEQSQQRNNPALNRQPQQRNNVPAGQRLQPGAGYVAAPIELDVQVRPGVINRVVNAVNAKAAIVNLLIEIAFKFDQAALDKAYKLAGNDASLRQLINKFVSGKLVKLIRAQKQGVPCAQCVLDKVYSSEKATMDAIAQKCGVESFGLANLK